MAYEFTVSGRIAKPVHEVFEAVADPKQLSGYFTTGSAQGRLETGATVTWDFADFPGAFPVRVERVLQDREIVLHWTIVRGGQACCARSRPISNTASTCARVCTNKHTNLEHSYLTNSVLPVLVPEGRIGRGGCRWNYDIYDALSLLPKSLASRAWRRSCTSSCRHPL